MNENRKEKKSDAIVSFMASIDWARSGSHLLWLSKTVVQKKANR